MRKMRMAAPSHIMVKVGLRTADVAGTGLADIALGAAGTSTSPEPMMSTLAGPSQCALTLPEPAIDTLACSRRIAPHRHRPIRRFHIRPLRLARPALTSPDPAIDSLSVAALRRPQRLARPSRRLCLRSGRP